MQNGKDLARILDREWPTKKDRHMESHTAILLLFKWY